MRFKLWRLQRLFIKQTTTTGFLWRLDIYGRCGRMAGVR